MRSDRQISERSNQRLLERLEAENAQLRDCVVGLMLELQALQADALARLARGTGVTTQSQLGVQTAAYDESAKAFCSVWRDRMKSR